MLGNRGKNNSPFIPDNGEPWVANAPRLVQKGGEKISHFFCDGGKMG